MGHSKHWAILPEHDKAISLAMLADLAKALKVDEGDLYIRGVDYPSETIFTVRMFGMAAGYPVAHITHVSASESYYVGCQQDDDGFRYAPSAGKAGTNLPLNAKALAEWNDSYSMPAKRLQQIIKLEPQDRTEEDTAWDTMWMLRRSLVCEVYTVLEEGTKVNFTRGPGDSMIRKGVFMGTGKTRGKYADDYVIIHTPGNVAYHVPTYCVEAA